MHDQCRRVMSPHVPDENHCFVSMVQTHRGKGVSGPEWIDLQLSLCGYPGSNPKLCFAKLLEYLKSWIKTLLSLIAQSVIPQQNRFVALAHNLTHCFQHSRPEPSASTCPSLLLPVHVLGRKRPARPAPLSRRWTWTSGWPLPCKSCPPPLPLPLVTSSALAVTSLVRSVTSAVEAFR